MRLSFHFPARCQASLPFISPLLGCNISKCRYNFSAATSQEVGKYFFQFARINILLQHARRLARQQTPCRLDADIISFRWAAVVNSQDARHMSLFVSLRHFNTIIFPYKTMKFIFGRKILYRWRTAAQKADAPALTPRRQNESNIFGALGSLISQLTSVLDCSRRFIDIGIS